MSSAGVVTLTTIEMLAPGGPTSETIHDPQNDEKRCRTAGRRRHRLRHGIHPTGRPQRPSRSLRLDAGHLAAELFASRITHNSLKLFSLRCSTLGHGEIRPTRTNQHGGRSGGERKRPRRLTPSGLPFLLRALRYLVPPPRKSPARPPAPAGLPFLQWAYRSPLDSIAQNPAFDKLPRTVYIHRDKC